MNIKLNDGVTREFQQGTASLEMARELDGELYKNALAAQVDGKLCSLYSPVESDCEVKILTFEDEGGRWVLRHTASHVMAQAVKRLFPEVKLAIGPATENGFYYDFDSERTFSQEDFAAIEKEMTRISRENLRLERFELPREEAIRFMEERGEP